MYSDNYTDVHSRFKLMVSAQFNLINMTDWPTKKAGTLWNMNYWLLIFVYFSDLKIDSACQYNNFVVNVYVLLQYNYFYRITLFSFMINYSKYFNFKTIKVIYIMSWCKSRREWIMVRVRVIGLAVMIITNTIIMTIL